METTAASPQASSKQSTKRGEERIKDKPKKGSAPTVPAKKPKQKAVKSPKKQKKLTAKKVTDRGKQKEDDDGDDEADEDEELEEEEEEVLEEGDKKEAKAVKKEETKRFGVKRRNLLVGECREEKAPYVKVREARMVTLADKVSNVTVAYLPQVQEVN